MFKVTVDGVPAEGSLGVKVFTEFDWSVIILVWLFSNPIVAADVYGPVERAIWPEILFIFICVPAVIVPGVSIISACPPLGTNLLLTSFIVVS